MTALSKRITLALRAWKLAATVVLIAFLVLGGIHYLSDNTISRLQSSRSELARLQEEREQLKATLEDIARLGGSYRDYAAHALGAASRELWYDSVAQTAQQMPILGEITWTLEEPQNVELPQLLPTPLRILAHDLIIEWKGVLEQEPLDFVSRLQQNCQCTSLWQELEYSDGGQAGADARARLRIFSIEKETVTVPVGGREAAR